MEGAGAAAGAAFVDVSSFFSARPRRAKSTPSSSPAGVATAPLPSPRRVSALAIAPPRPLVSRAPLDSPPRRRCSNTWRWTCARWRRPGGGARARGGGVRARARVGGEDARRGVWIVAVRSRRAPLFGGARRIAMNTAARVRASGGARDASRRRARQNSSNNSFRIVSGSCGISRVDPAATSTGARLGQLIENLYSTALDHVLDLVNCVCLSRTARMRSDSSYTDRSADRSVARSSRRSI